MLSACTHSVLCSLLCSFMLHCVQFSTAACSAFHLASSDCGNWREGIQGRKFATEGEMERRSYERHVKWTSCRLCVYVHAHGQESSCRGPGSRLAGAHFSAGSGKGSKCPELSSNPRPPPPKNQRQHTHTCIRTLCYCACIQSGQEIFGQSHNFHSFSSVCHHNVFEMKQSRWNRSSDCVQQKYLMKRLGIPVIFIHSHMFSGAEM